ncbi:MAG: hypothetical protein IJD67_06125 [Clostridia bacterium]|nr:hypothetical protein [Clostridia bacterium]
MITPALGHVTHVAGTEVFTSATHHWNECTGCGTEMNKEKHSGGNATCTSKAVCSVCNESYGDVKAHEYDKKTVASEYFKSDATCAEPALYYYSCVCGEKGEETFKYGSVLDHDYKYNNTDQKYLKSEATCTNRAVYYKSCVCGAYGEDVFEHGATLSHNYKNKIVDEKYLKSEATCTAMAVYYMSCDCGHYNAAENAETFDNGEVKAHSYRSVVTLPTCEAGGITTHTCSVCGDNDTSDPTEKLEHNYVQIGREFNCLTGGTETKQCTKCYDVKTDNIEEGHTYEDTVVPPTCSAEGYTLHKCSICGDSYQDAATNKIDHAEFDDTVVAPTCTEKGYTLHKCKACGFAEKTEETDAFGHDIKTERTKDPSCTETGTDTESCDRDGCQYTNTVTVAKTAHQYNNIETFASTCAEDGYFKRSCVCGDHYIEINDADKKGHKWDEENLLTKSSTCTTQGYTYYKCERCNAEDIQDTLEIAHTWVAATCTADQECSSCHIKGESAKGHSYDAGAVTDEATCTAKGEMTYTCTNDECGHSYTEDIEALGHNTVNVAWTEQDPEKVEGKNCTYVKTKTATCATCGETVAVKSAEYVSHNYQLIITTAATCSEAGEKTETCSVCSATGKKESYSDAAAHKMVTVAEKSSDMKCAYCTYQVIHSDSNSANFNGSNLEDKGGVSLGNADLSFDDTTKDHLKDKENITIEVGTKDKNDIVIDEDYLEKIGNSVIYDFIMKFGDQVQTSFNNGKITIRLPYVLDGQDPDDVVIWYINDEGEIDCIGDENGENVRYIEVDGNGYVVFETNHFSYYTVNKLTAEKRCERDGHIEKVVEQAATCLIDGYRNTVCTRCGKVIETEIINAKGSHTIVDTVVALATCTQNGSTNHECSECDHSYVTIQKATGHNFEEISRVGATCTENGTVEYECKNENCNETYTQKLPMVKHTYEKAEVVEPTCEALGYTKYKCNTCDSSYNGDHKLPKDHTYVSETIAPTCISGGYTKNYCSVCNKRFADTDTVEATGHDYNIEKATCNTNKVCDRCNYIEELATGDHDMTSEGKCGTCGTPCVHEYYKGTIHAPECEKEGYTDYYCSFCGHSVKKDYVDAADHSWKDGDVKAPTCSDDGYKLHVCVSCGATDREELPKSNEYHESVKEVIVPTCEDEGYTREYCRICKETLAITDEVEALGHEFKIVDKAANTCTENGYIITECVHCKKSEKEKLNATGHNYVDKVCTNCGKKDNVGICEHVDISECKVSYSFVLESGVHDCDDGVKITYTCPLCEETVKVEFTLEHVMEREEIDLTRYGEKCGEVKIVIESCTRCEYKDVYGKYHNNMYVEYERDVNEDGSTTEMHSYTCDECGYGFVCAITDKKEKCVRTTKFEYIYAVDVKNGKFESFTVESKRSSHNADVNEEEDILETIISTEKGSDGKELTVHDIHAVYRCEDCGIVTYHVFVRQKFNADGKMVYVDQFVKFASNEEETEFHTVYGMSVEVEYGLNDEGKSVIIKETEYDYAYAPDGTLSFVDGGITTSDTEGNKLSYYSFEYEVIDGEKVLISDYTREYVLVTMPDGTVDNRESKVVSNYYEDGKLILTEVESWRYEYAEESKCILYVSHFYPDGTAEHYSIGEHGTIITEYELVDGVSCENGIIVKHVCEDCGLALTKETNYNHSYDEEEHIDFSEFGAECAGYIIKRICKHCEHEDIRVEPRCKFAVLSSETKELADGYTHTLTIFACRAHGGFRYMIDHWEVGEGCVVQGYDKYRFGIESGAPKLEITIDLGMIDKHDREEITDKSIGVEKDEAGRDLTVSTIETKYVCSICKDVADHTKIITKADGNGYKLVIEYTYEYVDGKEYTKSVAETEYGMIKLTSGEDHYYETGKVVTYYDADGNEVDKAIWTYKYEGDSICKGELSIMHSNGSGMSGSFEEHLNEIEKWELLEGAKSCKDGVVYTRYCTECGEIKDTYTEYWHHESYETVDLSKYGCEHGCFVEINTCLCGESSSIYFGGNCKLEEESCTDVVIDGVKHQITVMRCLDKSCGCVYSTDIYELGVGNCTYKTFVKYSFGEDENGDPLYSVTVCEGTRAEHSMNTQKTVISDVTDEKTGERTIVYETKASCEKCKLVTKWDQETKKYNSDEELISEEFVIYDCGSDVKKEVEKRTITYGKVTTKDGNTFNVIMSEERVYGDFVEKKTYTYNGSPCSYTLIVQEFDSKGELIYRDEFSSENHNTEQRAELVKGAKTCLDGVKVYYVCTNCGEIDGKEKIYYEHYTVSREVVINKDDGKCSRYVYIDSCPCGEKASVNYGDHLVTVKPSKVEDGDKITHYITTHSCRACEFKYVTDSYTVTNGCEATTVTSHTVYNGTEIIWEGKSENTSESHKYVCKELESEDYIEKETGYKVSKRIEQNECDLCGKIDNRIERIEKASNGMIVYEEVKYYDAESDEITEISIWEYEIYTANGKTSRRTTRHYTNKGGYSDEYVYNYLDDNPCVREVIYTNVNGKEEKYTETNHADQTETYTLAKGSKSCEDGVIVTYYCTVCKEQLDQNTIYTHNMFYERKELEELGSKCGGDIVVEQCACGENLWVNVNLNCSYNYSTVKYEDANGIAHTRRVYTCMDEKCGFVYHIDEWTVVGKDCNGTEYCLYGIGYNENTKEYAYEIMRSDSIKAHDMQTEVTEDEPTTEKDESGTEYTVKTITTKEVCSVCGEITDHYVTVNKYDKDDNLIYTKVEHYNVSDGTVESDSVTLYGVTERIDGSLKTYKLQEKTNYYTDGKVKSSVEITYKYDDKYCCLGSMTYIHSGGKNYTETFVNHGKTIENIEFAEGSDSCEDGYTITGYCEDCGHEFYSDYRKGHNTNHTEVDLSEFGQKCEGYLQINECRICNKTTNMHVYGCKFEQKGDRVTETIDGVEYTTYTMECTVCGFSYKQAYHNEFAEDCSYVRYSTFTFGSGEGQREYTYCSGNGKSHKSEYVYENPIESTEVVGDQILKVVTDVSKHVCSRCSNTISKDINIHWYDTNGIVIQSSYEYMRINESTGQLYTSNKHVREYATYVRKDGKNDSYPVKNTETQYNIDGTENLTTVQEYVYKDGNYCTATVITTYSNGKVVTTEEELDHNYERCYVLVNGATDCTEGVASVFKCIDCGKLDREATEAEYYVHTAFVSGVPVSKIDLSEYGAECGTHLNTYSCACGKVSYQRMQNDACDFEFIESRQIILEDNISWHVELYQCSDCGFAYVCASRNYADENCKGYYGERFYIGVDVENETYVKLVENVRPTGDFYHKEKAENETSVKDGVTTNIQKHICEKCGVTTIVHTYVRYTDDEGYIINGSLHEYYILDPENNVLSHSSYDKYKYYVQSNDSGSRELEVYRYHEYKDGDGNVTSKVEYTIEYDETYCNAREYFSENGGEAVLSREFDNHWFTEDEWIIRPTCTQKGVYDSYCCCCNESVELEAQPLVHSFYHDADKELYVCGFCGLESDKSANKKLVLEDLTGRCDDDENYVVGYFLRYNETITYSVKAAIVDGEGNEIALTTGVTDDGVSKVYISFDAVNKAAEELSDGEYSLKVTFTPVSGEDANDHIIYLTAVKGNK